VEEIWIPPLKMAGYAKSWTPLSAEEMREKRRQAREKERQEKLRERWEEARARFKPGEEETDICLDVIHVTDVSLTGWLFPAPWVNGRMQGARSCQSATLGLCAKNHLHAIVISEGEKKNFQWEMSEKVIHAPIQQADLVAAIVMEASSTDENILQRYVSGCKVTNTTGIVEWCQMPFCGCRHAVLVDPDAMLRYSSDSEDDFNVLQIPWVLPSNVSGRPIELQKHTLGNEELTILLEKLTQHKGSRVLMCSTSEPWREPWKVSWYQRSQISTEPTILIGGEMIKDIDHYNEFAKPGDGEHTVREGPFPKNVFDVEIGATVPYTSKIEYAALSYVWAQHSEKTTISTLQKLSAELAIRYWWVDRLCMRTEKERAEEIPLMAGYYKNAATTVIYDREMASKTMNDVSLEDVKAVWTLKALSKASEKLRSYLMATTWAGRVWTLQEFLLATRILVATGSGLVEGYMLGSWGQAMRQAQGSLCLSWAPWYTIELRPGGFERRLLEPVPGVDGLGSSNYTLSSPELAKLSLGATWKRAKGRRCTKEEDLVYGMLALLDQNEKVTVEYSIGWAELMRRCCQWGLVKSDVMTSDQICGEQGMCWAPDPTGTRVPSLADWQMTPVPVRLATYGCEVSLPQVIIRTGSRTSNNRNTWGSLEAGGVNYSAVFKDLTPLTSQEYTGLIIAARSKQLLVVLANKQGTGRNVFHKVGMCEVIINDDEDEVRDLTDENVIIGHRHSQNWKYLDIIT